MIEHVLAAEWQAIGNWMQREFGYYKNLAMHRECRLWMHLEAPAPFAHTTVVLKKC